MKILPSIIHPHVIPNTKQLLSLIGSCVSTCMFEHTMNNVYKWIKAYNKPVHHQFWG